jgi:hypothetical protein
LEEMTWRQLNNALNEMNEAEVLARLEAEKKGARRLSILERLHQRYSSLRVARERYELLAQAEKL